MSSSILNNTIFGAYEIFGNLIPGTIVLTTIISFAGFSLEANLANSTLIPSDFIILFLIFLSYVLGVAIQGIAAKIEMLIYKWVKNYPSKVLLTNENKTFPDSFKQKVKNVAIQKFGVTDNDPPQHIFDLCYTFLIDRKVSTRVVSFLNLFNFSRNIMTTMWIEALILFLWSAVSKNLLIALSALLCIVLSYVFYLRFQAYGESFAKEVFRSFLVNEAS